MTGLKSGSGDDLWGDDANDKEDEVTETDQQDDPEELSDPEEGDNSTAKMPSIAATETTTGTNPPISRDDSTNESQPYIIRRAIQDKSVQFERDERLTFFVHDDVVNGERQLLSEMEATLGRSVPKFDVREAVYRAALRNPEDVLAELVEMGYSPNED